MKREQIAVAGGLLQSPPLSVDFRKSNTLMRLSPLKKSGGVI